MIKRLVNIFFWMERKERAFLWLGILSAFPVVCALFAQLSTPFLEEREIAVYHLFPAFNFFLYLHFLLPVFGIFAGNALIREFAEKQTLVYLLMRPNPKWQLIAGRYLALAATYGSVIILSLFLTYSALNITSGFAYINGLPVFFQSAGVLLLGLLAYLSLFGFLGTWMKKPILFGLFFAFGWENFIGSWPGNIKYLTIIHYLHSLFPTFFKTESVGLLKLLPQSFKLVPDGIAVTVLILLTMVFTGLSCLIFSEKEYGAERG